MSDFDESNSLMEDDFDQALSPNQGPQNDMSDMFFQSDDEDQKNQVPVQNQNENCQNVPQKQQTDQQMSKNGRKQIIYNYEELKSLQRIKKIAIKPKWNHHFIRDKICTEIPSLKQKIKSKKTQIEGVSVTLASIQDRNSHWATQRDKKIFSKSKQQFMKKNQFFSLKSKIL